MSGARARYADLYGERLLAEYLTQVEAVCGSRLYPVVSYTRIVEAGQSIAPHVDREGLDLTLSWSITADSPWKFSVELPGESWSALTSPGDAWLIRGREWPHWRPPYPGVQCLQLLLHYTTDPRFRFDRRPPPDRLHACADASLKG